MKGFKVSFKALLSGLALTFLLLGPAPQLRAVESAAVIAQEGGEAASGAQQTEHKEEQSDEEAFRHSASVKALGAKFGLNPEQAATVFTVANFIVLALLVGWYLLKTLPKTFRSRTSAIEKQLGEARAASEEANNRIGSVEARLAKLDEQIAAMRVQAEKDAQKDEQRMKASVEEEKQKILTSAEQEITAATAQARRQIQQYAADLAIDQAAKKLVVTAETDRALVREFARKLGADLDGGRN